MYAVPVIFYAPGRIIPRSDSTAIQHIDILPSVLDYLQYPFPYFAFGTSVFRQGKNGLAYNYLNETYAMISDTRVLTMEPNGNYHIFRLPEDASMTTDLGSSDEKANELSSRLKAFIQNFNYAVIHNEMTAKPTTTLK
jgi:hypothetical protein